jgi:2-polyprenyl-3-methyl-5-hydroxy-6-metoxy-1,4-benzoquinol methylase
MQGSAGDAVAYHESLASGWSARYASGGMRRRADFFRADVLPRLSPKGDWLDVGCGSGVFSAMLAEAGARVLGIDGSTSMVGAARANVPSACFEVARVEQLGGLGGPFDGAISLSVLEYIDDPEASLSAIAQRLNPGARLCVSLPNRGSTLRLAQKLIRPLAERAGAKSLAYLDTSRRLWTRPEAETLARSAGFEVDAVLGFDPVAPRLLWPLVSPSLWFVVARRR